MLIQWTSGTEVTAAVPALRPGPTRFPAGILRGRRIAVLVTIAMLLGAARGAKADLLATGETAGAPLEEMFQLYQPYLPNIRAYEPMYFLVGTRPEKSTFQFSFQYRLINTEGPLARQWPWLEGFRLAYTQTSFWDLGAESKPFEDTSYKPEAFFISGNLRPKSVNGPWAYLQAGVQHESNGRGGNLSRSTNRLYLQPTLIWFWREHGTGVQLSPRAWVYAGNDHTTNPDLADYRGYCDLQIKFGWALGLVAEARVGAASAGGSLQVDLSYPLHRSLFRNFSLYLHGQYVNVVAESLLHYQQRTEALRFGISLVR